jgi:hypothetical protein
MYDLEHEHVVDAKVEFIILKLTHNALLGLTLRCQIVLFLEINLFTNKNDHLKAKA